MRGNEVNNNNKFNNNKGKTLESLGVKEIIREKKREREKEDCKLSQSGPLFSPLWALAQGIRQVKSKIHSSHTPTHQL